MLQDINAYWRAANYLSVGQIYLLDNPLLHEPLSIEHIKPRLVGHFGTVPGINFIYAHMNRIIRHYALDVLLLLGPGHGAAALLANTYLEGSYTLFYPHITEDIDGMRHLFRQFSFPGGVPSHATPETPGSIHEGGELGYVLSHAYGAVFDNPHLLACCIIGDGEAETAALACSWHANKFLDPVHDGAVLPILHLNGYKIANPTYLARMSHEELRSLFIGYGYKPYFVEGSDPMSMHALMAKTLDCVVQDIQSIQEQARKQHHLSRPRWPMIILRTPKGWTGPKMVDGKKSEDSWRSHQVPLTDFSNPEHLSLLETWLKSYQPEELFDTQGTLHPTLRKLAPEIKKCMGMNPHANGGKLLCDLIFPQLQDHALVIHKPGTAVQESARILGNYLQDLMQKNLSSKNFRLFGPDETASNRLDAVFTVTNRNFQETILPEDDHLAHDGRVMEVLSEHLCQGWLEGYLLTGRHGLFSCYEAFIHIVDSMCSQHAKWLKVAQEVPWRAPIASLNYFLTSHVWRQDHNGFSHQDPGFIDLLVNKKAETVRIYYPPDANTLLCIADHCLRSRNYINVIVAGKQPALQYLSLQEAQAACAQGASIWKWASHDEGENPDLVIVSAGDIPTLEALATVDLLRTLIPSYKIRFVNVIDLMALQQDHPHGLSDTLFDALFTNDKPILFAHHGYPWIIHRLTYKRKNHQNLHVRGYIEEGTTTTPFDMAVRNRLDRFHLALDAISNLENNASLKAFLQQQLQCHHEYIRKHGDDMPEIRNWAWPY